MLGVVGKGQAGKYSRLSLFVLAIVSTSFTASAWAQSHEPLVGYDSLIGADTAARASPSTLSLEDAVYLTLSRHPEISRGLASVSRSRAELGMARSVWLPQVSYQANIGPNMLSGKSNTGLNDNMAGPSIALNQRVWDFGRSKGEIASAASTEKQREFELEMAADQLAERGAITFLDVKRFEALAEESNKHVESLQRLRGLIVLRVNAGISNRSDLLMADVRVEGARGDAIQAGSSFMSAKVSLANLIGVMPRVYSNPAEIIADFPERVGEPDLNNVPTIAAAEQAELAAQARIGQARAESYPTLGVQLGYSRNNYSYNQNNNAFSAMMTVSGDIFRGGNRYRVQAAQQERRAAGAEKEAAFFELRGKALSAREEIRGGFRRIEAFRYQEKQAREASRIFFEEYKLGKRSLTDLLNAELEIYRAASARINAEHDVMSARIRSENVYGDLRPSLGLPATLQGGEEDE